MCGGQPPAQGLEERRVQHTRVQDRSGCAQGPGLERLHARQCGGIAWRPCRACRALALSARKEAGRGRGAGLCHAVSERHTDRTGGPIGWAGSQKVGLGRGMAARARSAFSCGGTTRARFRFGTKGTKNTRGPRPFGRSAPRRYGVGFPFDHPSSGCCSRLPILTFHLDADSEGAFCLNHLPWVRTYAAGYPPSSSFGGSASTDPRSVPRHLRPCEPSTELDPALPARPRGR